MTLFAAKVVTGETATNGAQETSVLLGHCRSIGIVVGGVRVCGLGRKLVLGEIRLRWGTGSHLLLVCLVRSECVVLAVLLLLLLMLLWVLRLLRFAIVSSMALGVAGIVLAVRLSLHAVLESACLWRTVRVLSSRRTKLLRAVATLLLTIGWCLWVCIGVIIRVLISTLLLMVLTVLLALALAVAALVPVVRHDGQVIWTGK